MIDSKTHKGEVRVDRIGGLFAPRRAVLLIGGRHRTKLIDGVERQIQYVSRALAKLQIGEIDIRGALCFPDADGLPLLSRLSVRDIVIDGPKPVAKLVRRAGPLDPDKVARIWTHLGRAFPAA